MKILTKKKTIIGLKLISAPAEVTCFDVKKYSTCSNKIAFLLTSVEVGWTTNYMCYGEDVML